MIRCAWCGAANYAIDSWCASCSRHLDYAPPAPAPRRRRRRNLLAPAVAAVGVAIVLVLPVATRLASAGHAWMAALPNTAAAPGAPAAPATSSAMEPAPTPDSAPTPEATPEATPEPQPAPAAPQPPAPPDLPLGQAADDPASAVARFYQAVSGHDFAAAAGLWSSRMQARYPPAVYIDHRFAATQQINLQVARILGSHDGAAVVFVRVVEVLDGQTRYWVGTWQLVSSDSGWLLDRPNLRSGT